MDLVVGEELFGDVYKKQRRGTGKSYTRRRYEEKKKLCHLSGRAVVDFS